MVIKSTFSVVYQACKVELTNNKGSVEEKLNKKTARMLCFVFFSQAVNYSLYFVPVSKYIIRSLLTTNNNPIMGILWQRTLQPLIINKFETMLLKELLHSRREILTNDLKLERL
jgi:hypothetical protein